MKINIRTFSLLDIFCCVSSEVIIKLQNPLQHKDLMRTLLSRGKSHVPLNLLVCVCVSLKVFAQVDFPQSNFPPHPGQDPTAIVTRFNTSAIQSLRRFIQPVPGLLLLVKKIIFVFPTALWTTKSSCFILASAVKPCSPANPLPR